uniref:DNA-protecting protein DprA n=1 Tax=candidate division WOR-3 bacterium TaxID=2052148 RepID=A0A7C4U7K9_UNCW3
MESFEKLLLKLSIAQIEYKTLIGIFNDNRLSEILSLSENEINEHLGKEKEKLNNIKKEYVERIYDKLKSESVKIICLADEEYPYNLKIIPNPPPIIYVKGELKEKDINAAGIVGTRKPTEYGRIVARDFAKKLTDYDITIVSGLALGIDTSAHLGAIENGGRTIGVIGCGIDVVYPSSNKKLYELVRENGAIISEFPPGTKPLSYNFPLRNRIISGLSKVIIAVQANIKSGVFSTVKWATDFGREVFAVPGNINVPQSEGTNRLLKMGISPLTDIEDILPLFGITSKKIEEEIELPEDEKKIFDILSDEPLSLETIAGLLGFTIPHTSSALLLLELKGYVKDVGGKKFVKNKI